MYVSYYVEQIYKETKHKSISTVDKLMIIYVG